MGKVYTLFHLFKFVGILFTCTIIVGKEEHPLTGLLEMEKHKTREEVYIVFHTILEILLKC